MAHTKAGGSTKLGRDSAGRRLGVKRSGGSLAKNGDILVRQRGTKIQPGRGTTLGRDHTIQATIDGTVTFTSSKQTKFTGQKNLKTTVSVKPLD